MSLVFLILKASRQVDFGNFDLPIFFFLIQLDVLILIQFIRLIRYWR